ncbi:MAG TPA: PPK2 family polyphosphate kinase [Rugosimonospora sp.]|nr:PPK2 family polyphosphate kinase [Rugosimonospora sp.]
MAEDGGLRGELRVAPGRPVELDRIDPAGTPGLPRERQPKRWAREQLRLIGEDLASHQERLYANAKVARGNRSILLVLQAMDCGGKDGTTRRVAGLMNPQGLRIVSFGKPTEEELAHDFLWRIRRALPPAGYLGVFNRSHYEDVLVVRVHGLVDEATWRDRYEQIRRFEQELVDAGTTLVKVMLHISFKEQAERLAQRLADPTKHWKYNPGDIDERALWARYQAAYEDALRECSTPDAPWYVVPADHKWYRDWAVATLLRETMLGLGLTYPPGDFSVETELRRLAGSLRGGSQEVNSP